MRNTFKMVSRVVAAVAALALGTSIASADQLRTFTLNCNHLGAVTASITSWTWIQSDGTPIDDITQSNSIAVVHTTSWTCTGENALTVSVNQPLGGAETPGYPIGFTAGVVYTVHFGDSTPDTTTTSPLVAPGQPVSFRDRYHDTDPVASKNATVVAVLGK